MLGLARTLPFVLLGALVACDVVDDISKRSAKDEKKSGTDESDGATGPQGDLPKDDDGKQTIKIPGAEDQVDPDPILPEEPNGWRLIKTPEGVPTGTSGSSSVTIGPVGSTSDFIFINSLNANQGINSRFYDGIVRYYNRATKVWAEIRPDIPENSMAYLPVAHKNLIYIPFVLANGTGANKGGAIVDMKAGTTRAMNMTGVPNTVFAWGGSEKYILAIDNTTPTASKIYDTAADQWNPMPTTNNPYTRAACTNGIRKHYAHVVDNIAIVAFECGKKVAGKDVYEVWGDFLNVDTGVWKQADVTKLKTVARGTLVPRPGGAAFMILQNATNIFKFDVATQTIQFKDFAAYYEERHNGKVTGATLDAPNKQLIHVVDGVATNIPLPAFFGDDIYSINITASDRYIVTWGVGRNRIGYPIVGPDPTVVTIMGRPDKTLSDAIPAVYDVKKGKWFELPFVNRVRSNATFKVFEINDATEELTVFSGGISEGGDHYSDVRGGVISLKTLVDQPRQCEHVKRDMLTLGSQTLVTARAGCTVHADCHAWYVQGAPALNVHFPVTASKVSAEQRTKMTNLTNEAQALCGEPVFEENSLPFVLIVGCGYGQCQISINENAYN